MNIKRLDKIGSLRVEDRADLGYKRNVLLSAIPEVMEKLGKSEAEARRLVEMILPAEAAALISDDWERNANALDMLGLFTDARMSDYLNRMVERTAAAFKVSVEDMLLLLFMDPNVSVSAKAEMLHIAKARGVELLIVSLKEDWPQLDSLSNGGHAYVN